MYTEHKLGNFFFLEKKFLLEKKKVLVCYTQYTFVITGDYPGIAD